MHRYIINSLDFGGDRDSRKSRKKFMRPIPFLFDEVASRGESLFEVYFIDSEEQGARTYHYGFTVSEEGINEEWLNYKTKSSRRKFKTIFYRNETEKNNAVRWNTTEE